MLARWWALVIWALVAASALFWAFRLFVKPPPAPPQAVVAQVGSGARGDLVRLFGADPPPPAVEAEPEAVADARFQLVGVVSPRSTQAAGEGLALIAVDGKPPKAFRVGAAVEGDTVLQSVRQRGASLGLRGGPALVALEIAPPAAPATGSLPSLEGPVSGAPMPLNNALPRAAGQQVPAMRAPGAAAAWRPPVMGQRAPVENPAPSDPDSTLVPTR